MLEEVQRQGAQAARKGLTVWDCPYLRADAMPAHSGESFLKWSKRYVCGRTVGIKSSRDARKNVEPSLPRGFER
jgi:hypothetical protein